MVKSVIFIEGAGGSREADARCREGFASLLKKAGFQDRLPRLVACGSRSETYASLRTALKGGRYTFVAMWIDSEDPLKDVGAVWQHLKDRDGWAKLPGATDEHVLLMTTCMETYIVADREALMQHYGKDFKLKSLPPLHNLEARDRKDIQKALHDATRDCKAPYAKGEESFKLLILLNPDVLKLHLPSFMRAMEILQREL